MPRESINHYSSKINSMELLLDVMVQDTDKPYNDYALGLNGSAPLGGVDEESFWKWREQLRMDSGAYEPLALPVRQAIHNNDIGVPYLHFLHVAQGGTEQAMVAFTENEDKGKRDLQLRVGLGRYLRRLNPDIDNEAIKHITNVFNYHHGKEQEVKFSEAEEDFIRVIDKGCTESCMQGMSYKGHVHPAAAYAYGDIQIAWLEDADGNISARTLVNNRKCSRIYGDKDKLEPALALLGIEPEVGALTGCRLRKIENRNGSGYIMPYVDRGIGSSGGALHADEAADYWELCVRGGDIDTTDGNTYDGVTQGDQGEQCCNCGDYADEDNMTYVEDNGMVCQACLDGYYRYAVVDLRGNEEYVHVDSVTYVECNDTCYLDSLDLSEFDLTYAESRNEWINIDDSVADIDGNTQHSEDVCKVGENSNGGIYILDGELGDYKGSLYLVDGDWVHEDSDEYAAVCELLRSMYICLKDIYTAYKEFVKAGNWSRNFATGLPHNSLMCGLLAKMMREEEQQAQRLAA